MTAHTVVEVVTLGRNIDDLDIGPPSPGHYYLVVLVPQDASLASEPATPTAKLGTVALVTKDNPVSEFVRMGGDLRCEVTVADSVDLDALAVIFSIDGEAVKCEGDKDLAWVDMRSIPATGDVILSQALGLPDGDAYRVLGRGWMDHNLVSIQMCALESPPEDDGEVTQ